MDFKIRGHGGFYNVATEETLVRGRENKFKIHNATKDNSNYELLLLFFLNTSNVLYTA